MISEISANCGGRLTAIAPAGEAGAPFFHVVKIEVFQVPKGAKSPLAFGDSGEKPA